MAASPREAERERRRSGQPPSPERLKDAVFTFGLLGIGVTIFFWGRSSGTSQNCCGELSQRDLELILCQQKLLLPPTPIPTP